MQYNTSITYNDTPWVLIDYSGLFLLNNCEEIEFSVGLVGDCRTLLYTAFLPICKLKCNNQYITFLLFFDLQGFTSEMIQVKPLFTAELKLQKIEIIFVST